MIGFPKGLIAIEAQLGKHAPDIRVPPAPRPLYRQHEIVISTRRAMNDALNLLGVASAGRADTMIALEHVRPHGLGATAHQKLIDAFLTAPTAARGRYGSSAPSAERLTVCVPAMRILIRTYEAAAQFFSLIESL